MSAECPELGMDAASIRRSFVEKLNLDLMKFPQLATRNDCYLALSLALRDRVLQRWVRSAQTYFEQARRTVIYMSAEYLPGPQLQNAVLSLGIEKEVREALATLHVSLDELIEHDEDPGLGNGGLGRLASCFLESMATLRLSAIGHGIRYEYGIFDQEIREGWQVERTDRWLQMGFPWEVRRPEIQHVVGLGGKTEHTLDSTGRRTVRWIPERIVKGFPSDIPVLGHKTVNTNFLRLWSAMAADDFDLGAFQVGDYWRAVEDKVRSENITKILYPPDETPAGKQLRLEQQYFFVSCTLQDCIRLLLQRTTIRAFGEKFAIQLNDTHPALAIAELMRLLMDVHGLEWDEAWQITLRSFSYTNHTLMPESLEKWSSALFARLLPRHLEIVHEINHRFIEDVRAKFPGDEMRVRRMSLIEEGVAESRVRMAHLATLGSHTINGVAEIHSNLLKQTVLRDFADMYPERFTNVTNGVTPRRFIGLTNPRLSQLLTEAIGDGWLTDAERLAGLERFADDSAFQEKWRAVKQSNKQELAEWLSRAHRMALDPTTLVDAHCKRIHEYKRQLLNVLHIVWLHQRAQAGTLGDEPPRTFIFAGKAAPGYWMAKLIIRLIHGVSTALDQDPAARGRLKVLFVPDFNVKSAQRIYPAVDVSEQISTSGTEASGTGNMKLAFNGALTIGTPDGANPEIRNAVGPENFFLCGLTAEGVVASKKSGYSPPQILSANPELVKVVESIARGLYSPEEPALFMPIVRSLLDQDTFFVLADFQSYVECQRQVASTWKDVPRWTRASILNVARCGRFSSDRSVREYAERIWKVTAVDMVP